MESHLLKEYEESKSESESFAKRGPNDTGLEEMTVPDDTPNREMYESMPDDGLEIGQQKALGRVDIS